MNILRQKLSGERDVGHGSITDCCRDSERIFDDVNHYCAMTGNDSGNSRWFLFPFRLDGCVKRWGLVASSFTPIPEVGSVSGGGGGNNFYFRFIELSTTRDFYAFTIASNSTGWVTSSAGIRGPLSAWRWSSALRLASASSSGRRNMTMSPFGLQPTRPSASIRTGSSSISATTSGTSPSSSQPTVTFYDRKSFYL